MKGLKLLGHPLHPAIVHFPVAAWTATLVTDVLALAVGSSFWNGVSEVLLAVGVLMALAAMTAGFMDLVALPAGGTAQKAALRHMYVMAGAWTIYAIDLLLRFFSSALGAAGGWIGLALSASGFVALAAGTHLGARLVYDLGVGSTGRPGA